MDEERKERDVEHDRAARLETVRHDRARGATANLERALELQRAAEEFRSAFAAARRER